LSDWLEEEEEEEEEEVDEEEVDEACPRSLNAP
jgi:hypothetical protein